MHKVMVAKCFKTCFYSWGHGESCHTISWHMSNILLHACCSSMLNLITWAPNLILICNVGAYRRTFLSQIAARGHWSRMQLNQLHIILACSRIHLATWPFCFEFSWLPTWFWGRGHSQSSAFSSSAMSHPNTESCATPIYDSTIYTILYSHLIRLTLYSKHQPVVSRPDSLVLRWFWQD